MLLQKWFKLAFKSCDKLVLVPVQGSLSRIELLLLLPAPATESL